MKKFILMCCLAAGVIATASAQAVKFEINSGMDDNATLKARIEQNVSNLLTEINRAQSVGAPDLNYSSFTITADAKNSLSMLWENVPFACIEEEIVEKILGTAGGYQVRNIPLELRPSDATVTDDSYQEAVIDFDHAGEITSFYFAISNNLYSQVMQKGGEVTDTRRRQLILDYVEHFRTAYNQKDLKFLDAVFSDDAIIITGKVTTRKPVDSPIPITKVTYKTQDKQTYLSNLRRIFATQKYVRVTFSEIKIQRHPTMNHYYGVRLRQGYSTPGYSDDGYVYLLWDFIDEQHPQIHVRTWQPYWLDDSKTTRIAEDEIFDIGDFNLDI